MPMPPTDPATLVALCGFALLAGFVDAVGGGGGLVQVPALLVLLPQQPVATLFGTNKLASIFGTSGAAWRYARGITLPWPSLLPAIAAALAGAWLGARLVSHLNPTLLKPVILALLVLALTVTLARPQLGRVHAPRLSPRTAALASLGVGFGLGFYDGFFGPGTGSFLILSFVAVFGFSFLAASAYAKLVNVSTNLAALVYFIPHGDWLPTVALPMAACNLAGSFLGSHLAIRHGSGFVRAVFLLVVAALILRLGGELLRGA
ncbi:MAG: TSUP family transporter [Gammaproteobacteria bacterium]|nr:TSUP family transporter [Gammaproteobacteria bacterium]